MRALFIQEEQSHLNPQSHTDVLHLVGAVRACSSGSKNAAIPGLVSKHQQS